MRLHNEIIKREALLKKNIPPDQRWQGWPKKDPKWFLFPLQSLKNIHRNIFRTLFYC